MPNPEHTIRQKLRRAALTRLLDAGGPAAVQRLAKLRSVEQAALQANRPRPMPSNPAQRSVVFAIPLIGKHAVSNWDIVEATLARTLASFQRQDSPHWQAVICGQDRPDTMPANDPRIRFLPYSERPDGHDKVPKLRALASVLPTLGAEQGLFMPFDADDLLAPHGVSTLQAHPGGSLCAGGHILHAATGRIAPTATPSLAQPRQRPFWKFCGSCAAFPFRLDDGTADVTLFEALATHEHRLYPHIARMAGMHLHRLDAPLVAYLIDHGENFERRRGRGGFKARFTERFRITDPAEETRLHTLYGWTKP